jgi:hypothetical protein
MQVVDCEGYGLCFSANFLGSGKKNGGFIMSEKKVNFKKGKTPREELELPRLYFVTMDNWIEVIGEKAFLAWLRFYTWADREEETPGVNKWEEANIPNSFIKLAKKLGVGKGTFYNQILKPLWNVGLIDIEEYEDSKQKGQKPLNITVYKYPQNNIALATKPLEVVRNYDTDYSSNARTFAKMGGRPKSVDKSDSTPVLRQNGGGSEIEPGGFSNRTGAGSEPEHNNILNDITNISNNFNNTLNDLNNSSSSKEKNKTKEEEEENKISPATINLLKDYFSEAFVEQIIKYMKEYEITEIEEQELLDQVKRMREYQKPILDQAKFFVNGIHMNRSGVSLLKPRRTQTQQVQTKSHSIPIYNWLES